MPNAVAIMFRRYLLPLVVATGLAGCDSQPQDKNPSGALKVEIQQLDGRYQLVRNGEPYFIRGAGLNFRSLESFKAHGGNSIRTWNTDARDMDTMAYLDMAHAMGISVSLCLPVKPPRWGFDYHDQDKVNAQFEAIKAEVLKYKDHPALLTWIIGNELNHKAPDYQVYNAVNDIALMIKQLDPNHPTTTTLAGLHEDDLTAVLERAPSLDFISLQVYGQLNILPDFIKQQNFTKPFMITEWGAIGYWEVKQTDWHAPIEMNSSLKAHHYLQGYQQRLMQVSDQLIGNYVFLWGQKQERTPTWFGLFTENGNETEVVDVMHYLWNGVWPDNRAPVVNTMLLNGQKATDNIHLSAGQSYTASVDSHDPENQPLDYRWEVKPESDSEKEGGDFEESISSLQNLMQSEHSALVTFTAPTKPGAYRLFVYIHDEYNKVAHANIPFWVD